MKKITKRDVSFFFLGMFVLLLVETVWDWDNSVKSFKAGWNSYQPKTEMKQVK